MTISEIHSLFLSCNGVTTDTRTITPNSLFFALKGDTFNGHTFAAQALQSGAKYCVIDELDYQTIPNTILVDNVLQTLQDLANYHRNYLKIPIIALTGSNGKTTTKELIYACLSQAYNTSATKGNLNNHIGVPLTLLAMTKDTEIGIVEMGANHLHEINFLCRIAQPDYGYITNFGKAHLEGFGSLEGVIQGKTELYAHLIQQHKTIFINGADSQQVALSKGTTVIDINKTLALKFIDANPLVKVAFNQQLIESQIIGAYNYSNIAAAIAIAQYFKVSDLNIKYAIENYVPTNNRSQIIKKANCDIILDAYNANPSSMHAALQNFSNLNHNPKIVFLGDMFELGAAEAEEHELILTAAINLNINRIVCIGNNFYNTKITANKLTKYKDFNSFKAHFNCKDIQQACLLIKGSRGMAMERILELL